MDKNKQETLEEWLARGNQIKQVPPIDNNAIIESLKPKYKALMDQIKNRNKPKEKAPD